MSARHPPNAVSFVPPSYEARQLGLRSAMPRATAFLAHELAALWRFLSGNRKVPYKRFSPHVAPAASDLFPAHTQNLYAPSADGGRVLWFALRDREKVDFIPTKDDWINANAGHHALPKKNLGVLEATGTWIVDYSAQYTELQRWTPAEITQQIRRMLSAASLLLDTVSAFENALLEVLPR